MRLRGVPAKILFAYSNCIYCYGVPNFGSARFRWFIDTNNNLGLSRGSVIGDRN